MKKLIAILAAALLLACLTVLCQKLIDSDMDDITRELAAIRGELGSGTARARLDAAIESWQAFHARWEFIMPCGEFDGVLLSITFARDYLPESRLGADISLAEALQSIESIRKKQALSLEHIW